jgi:hypothetical protein
MTAILVISGDVTMQHACADAVWLVGRRAHVVPDLGAARHALDRDDFAGIIVHAAAAGDLLALAHLSTDHTLPPTAVITDEAADVTLWVLGATRSPSCTSVAQLVWRLVAMIDELSSGAPVHLPLRVAATAAKWTRRLRSEE